MNQHPNAAAASVTGGAALLIVWLLGHVNIDVSAEDGAAIAAIATAAVLFVGRNGIRGAWQRVWKGSAKPAAKKPTARKPPAK